MMPVTIGRACVRAFLQAIAALARECADQPVLLEDFLRVVNLAPPPSRACGRRASHVAARPLPRMRRYSALDLLQ